MCGHRGSKNLLQIEYYRCTDHSRWLLRLADASDPSLSGYSAFFAAFSCWVWLGALGGLACDRLAEATSNKQQGRWQLKSRMDMERLHIAKTIKHDAYIDNTSFGTNSSSRFFRTPLMTPLLRAKSWFVAGSDLNAVLFVGLLP